MSLRMKSNVRQVFILILLTISLSSCGTFPGRTSREIPPVPELVKAQCDLIGPPRIERISEHVWAAIGYDLANEILIHTPQGHVIIDPLMSPRRGEAARRDLLARVPAAPVKTIIYTHSHIDHIGGASLWMADSPPVWATDSFMDNFYRQYQVFFPVESIRGKRQFGMHAAFEDLPCNGIGRRADIPASLEGGGVVLPTHTFSGTKTLDLGGFSITLIEAPGETQDQLIVWIPKDRTLIGADNFYFAFPNLYTIRGTPPRPVDQWIKSIDIMRRLRPEHLVPCHTVPIHGSGKIARALTDYRDAIQWVRDEVIRRANQGHDLDSIAESIQLPPHLAGHPYTIDYYGQVDWSAKGIYTGNLGWFDGRPDKLYPLGAAEAARREILLMGGAESVMRLADTALQQDDLRWSIHLLAKLGESGLAQGDLKKALEEKLAGGYEKLALTLHNLNGRGYLLESAYELRHGLEKPTSPRFSENLVARVPLEAIFAIMATRLVPEKAMDVHEAVHFVFPDENRRFVLTIRRGIAEVVDGEPLPGTPDPVAVVTLDAHLFRRLAVKMISPVNAISSGKMKIKGSWLDFLTWFRRFERG